MEKTRAAMRKVAAALLGIVPLAASSIGSAQSDSFRMAAPAGGLLEVNNAFTKDGETLDIASLGTVGGLSVSGSVLLETKLGYLRIVLEAADGNEYLVYEANTLLEPSTPAQLSATCEETCSLGSVKVQALRFELQDATLKLDSISTAQAEANRTEVARAARTATTMKTAQLAEKVARIQASISENGSRWVAGETPVAALSYADKKRRVCGAFTNLYGFEYYRGGVFELPSESVNGTASNPSASVTSPYVAEFTWNGRHGQDWVTSVKDQGGCGSCWAFAATGATEVLTNVYFNKHLDLDLAEQDALSCSGAGTCAGGLPSDTLRYFATTGAVDEACFPYTAQDEACSDKCSSPTELIRIGGSTDFQTGIQTEDDLKAMIIEGPVSGGIYSWIHAMTLVGYKVLKAGDEVYLSSETQTGNIVIPDGDPLIGKTAWRFKNSWGQTWGDAGYVYVVTDINNIGWTSALSGPVRSLNLTDDDVACEDRDGDGYYNWGIGRMPPSCPAGIRPEADGDDSNACIGPADQFGYVQSICNEKKVDLGPLGKWRSVVLDLSAQLSITKWPFWWKWRAPRNIVVTFKAMPWQTLDGISVKVGGVDTQLRGRLQRMSVPFTRKRELLLSAHASNPQKILVSWWGEVAPETRRFYARRW